MAYIPNVNGEIILNSYFRHRLWVELWCSIGLIRHSPMFLH